MLLKLNLNKSFCGTHGLLERDEGLKFLPIKTYFEVAPRSPWSSLCDWSRELAPFLRIIFKTRTNRELDTRVFLCLKLFTCFCIDLSPAALEIFASSGWSLWLPQFWLTTISRKTLWATHLLLQSVPNNGSQVTYWLMTDSSLLLLRLSRKVFSPEGALPSNHPEGQ